MGINCSHFHHHRFHTISCKPLKLSIFLFTKAVNRCVPNVNDDNLICTQTTIKDGVYEQNYKQFGCHNKSKHQIRKTNKFNFVISNYKSFLSKFDEQNKVNLIFIKYRWECQRLGLESLEPQHPWRCGFSSLVYLHHHWNSGKPWAAMESWLEFYGWESSLLSPAKTWRASITSITNPQTEILYTKLEVWCRNLETDIQQTQNERTLSYDRNQLKSARIEQKCCNS